jgi:sec-independent protein translocase protein TatA
MSGLESPTHLLLILIVALLVLGPKRLPEVARGLGHGIRDFRDAVSGNSRDAKADASVEKAAVVDAVEVQPVPDHTPEG